MIKSSIVFVSIASLILVQTNAAQLLGQEISTWDRSTRGIDNYDDEQNPSIGCLLFGYPICYLYCFLSIDVYYYEIDTDAICDENQSCLCHYAVDAYLYDNWSMKFDADYVYWAIQRSTPLLQHVTELFNKPFRTAKQIKKILHPDLSPYQYSKLEIRDNSIASMFFDNGKVNENWVRAYVSDKLQEVFDSNGKYTLYTNYEMNFRDALKNVRDEGTLYNIAFELRTLKNEKLESIWREHLTTNKLQQPNIEIEEPETLDAILNHVITHEVIKQRDRMIVDPVIGQTVHSTLNSNKMNTRKFHY